MSFRFLLSLFLCSAACAAPISVPVTAVAEYVRQHNPDLAAARLQIEEAQGRLQQSGRLSNPELGFELKHDGRFEEGTMGLSFDQQFPLTSRLRTEKMLSTRAVKAAELEIKDLERKIIAEAQSRSIQLISLEQQRSLRLKQTELARKLSTFATDRAAAGEISALDAAQAQVDSQRLLLESRKLETERVSLLGELKPKLGVNAEDTLTITGNLPATVMPAKRSWDQRADYQLAHLQEEITKTDIDLAKANKWQDLNAGLILEGERMKDAPDGLERTGFIGFRFSLPLPFWNKNEGTLREKNATAQRAVLETRALAAVISNEAAAARAEMAANASLASETRDKLLPLVLQQTERLEKAYETGQTDLLTVLRAREQRLQLESAVLDATRDFHLARVRYEAATGTQP